MKIEIYILIGVICTIIAFLSIAYFQRNNIKEVEELVIILICCMFLFITIWPIAVPAIFLIYIGMKIAKIKG